MYSTGLLHLCNHKIIHYVDIICITRVRFVVRRLSFFKDDCRYCLAVGLHGASLLWSGLFLCLIYVFVGMTKVSFV
jgi:hypothetical protein